MDRYYKRVIHALYKGKLRESHFQFSFHILKMKFIHQFFCLPKLVMKRTCIVFSLFVLLLSSCSANEGETEIPNEEKEKIKLQLLNKNATAETKALHSNLWAIQSKGFMFGHHDDLMYGREWKSEPGRSDVKEVCGDFPAVFSVDFAQIMDDRRNNGQPLNDATTEDRKRAITDARRRGEVITACAHLNNPLTGENAWDNSNNNVVKQILQEGSEVNLKYISWLDNLAAFVKDLKDEDGNSIPIIFRPFHEHTQTWSWWGRKCTTAEEFIGLWKLTIDYLTNEKNINHFIYAISPQLDSPGTVDNILFRWPGDEYVDFIGMDCYHGTNTASFITNVKNLSRLSKDKMKPCGITETGIEGVRKSDGSEYSDYWTKEMLTPLIGKNISMVIMWRNKYDPMHNGHHFYGPWIGHSSSSDFISFYNSSITFFSQDLPDMYTMAEGIIVE